MHQRRFLEISKLLLDNPSSPIDPQRKFFYQVIGSALASDVREDLEKVLETIAQVTPEFSNWCQVICGYEAIERGDALEALEICIPSADRPLTLFASRLQSHQELQPTAQYSPARRRI